MDEITNRPARFWSRVWMKHQFDLICGFAAMVFVLLVWHFCSDKDFSFLMTLGSIVSFIAFALLVLKIVTTGHTSAISMKTLQAYALVFIFRLCSILAYEGYLPYDKTGDWFYQACEVLSLLLVVGLIGALLLKGSDKKWDTFSIAGVPQDLGIFVLALPALVLAAILHPNLNNNWFTDTAWAFALYLEAVAVVPQLVMVWNMSSKGQDIKVYERNYVFALAISRILHLVFWISSYQELNDRYTNEWHRRYPGVVVVLVQVVNVAIMADYVYYHLKAARSKQPFLLPHSV